MNGCEGAEFIQVGWPVGGFGGMAHGQALRNVGGQAKGTQAQKFPMAAMIIST